MTGLQGIEEERRVWNRRGVSHIHEMSSRHYLNPNMLIRTLSITAYMASIADVREIDNGQGLSAPLCSCW